MKRAVWAFIVILLVMAPVLDLAWNEPALDQSPGARCQLHATPAVASEPAYLVVALAIEWLLPFKSLDRSPLVSASIFIPPRV